MKKFAVIGLGRFGKTLALALSMSGAEVIAIDQNRFEIDNIADQVSHAVRLDSTDEEALIAQDVTKVEVAIVGIGQGSGGFESAVLTVVNLKNMGIKKIYARAENHIAGQVLLKVGATEIIYPEIEVARRLAFKLIAPQIADKIDFAPGFSLARVSAPAEFDGKTLIELQLRKKYHVNLIAIKRSENNERDLSPEVINVPRPDDVIYKDDVLMVAGSDEDLAKLPQD
jgi:trk system potassium uptake protein